MSEAFIRVNRYEVDNCRYSFPVHEGEEEAKRLLQPENRAELLALIEQHDENGDLFLEEEERESSEDWEEAGFGNITVTLSKPQLELRQLQHYRKLHDGLSDMIEGGRLQEGDIPDDYQWLVEMLASLPKE